MEGACGEDTRQRDAGWGVLIKSQLFIAVSLHRGEQERGRGRDAENGRMQERGGREGGYCHRCLNAPLLPAECQHLSPSSSHPLTHPPLHLTFPSCAAVKIRHQQMACVLQVS